jgi:hypothetical protein
MRTSLVLAMFIVVSACGGDPVEDPVMIEPPPISDEERAAVLQ